MAPVIHEDLNQWMGATPKVLLLLPLFEDALCLRYTPALTVFDVACLLYA